LDRRYVSWEDLKQDEDVEGEFTEEFWRYRPSSFLTFI
jgi:hypothetical protein